MSYVKKRLAELDAPPRADRGTLWQKAHPFAPAEPIGPRNCRSRKDGKPRARRGAPMHELTPASQEARRADNKRRIKRGEKPWL